MLSTTNMHMFNEKGTITKMKNVLEIIKEFYNELLKICDPEKVNKRAKSEQLEKIEKNSQSFRTLNQLAQLAFEN